ncbi:MAG: tetratricopeptide repeat protein [Ignavibacteriaceae bacterium]
MKNLLKFLPIIVITYSFLVFSQSIPDEFSKAMDYYNQKLYSDAHKLFAKIIKSYSNEDELYATARFYSANSLLKMGKKEEATTEFEFLANYVKWSKFREESLYTLGLIYFDLERYALCRKNLLILVYQYPGNEHNGIAMYWIGESYAAEGKLDEAIDFLKKAIEDKSVNTYREYSLYSLANVYEKDKDYQNAVKYYDELLTYFSSSPLAEQAQVRIGVCYFYLKDYYNSILELSNPTIRELSPDNLAEALYVLANSHYRVEEYSEAANTYSEVIQKFPNSRVFRSAQYGLGWSQFQQGKFNDAYNVFNHLSEGDDSIAVQSFIWKGEAKRYSGNYKEALKIFEEFLNLYPTDHSVPIVETLIGVIYFEQNKYDLSSKYLMNATSSDDAVTRAKALMMIGEIELNKKHYKKALENFEPAVQISNADSSVHLRSLLGLGVSLFFLGDADRAAETLRDAENIDPAFEADRLNFYMAECYFKSGKYQEALSRYNLVKTNNDEFVKQIIYSKGYCFFNLGNYDNAAYQFSDFIEKYPNDSRTTDARLRLADSYFGSKNFAAASVIFKKLFQSGKFSTDDPYTYYQYAQALYKSGETAAAINEFQKLQQKFPKTSYGENSLFTIGFIRFQDGEYKNAIDDYRNVLLIYKNTSLAPVVYYSIGDAYFNLEMYDSAIVNYQNVLVKYPSSDYVYDAVNGIQYSLIKFSKVILSQSRQQFQ